MSPSVTYTASLAGLGQAVLGSMVRTANGGSACDVGVPHGYAGSLTTRGDDNTGTVTLTAGHGITTGMKVDIYWSGGSGGVQYNVTVGTVNVNAMPFDLGIGDNLPAEATAVVVSPRVEASVAIDGDALALLALKQEFSDGTIAAASRIDFQDDADDVIAVLDLAANAVQVYDVEGGSANPFTGDPIVKAFVSNGSSTADATLRLRWLQDVTP